MQKPNEQYFNDMEQPNCSSSNFHHPDCDSDSYVDFSKPNYNMTRCKTCNYPISRSAPTCPNCGEVIYRPKSRIFMWVLLGFILGLGCATMVLNTDESSEVEQSSATIESIEPSAVEQSAPEISPDSLANPEIPSTGEEVKIDDGLTLSQRNALGSAVSYLRYSGFSREGLIDQLLYEKYSEEDAIWAADNADADWKQEALESAKSYIRSSGFSYQGLLDQLDYEGFTPEEASYGADNCQADWNHEALECAESYLRYSSFSKAELEGQLAYEGFTIDQIQYAITGVGY